MLDQILGDFLMLLVTVDPVGTLSLFVPLTAACSPAERAVIARRSVLHAGAVLLGFLIVGQIVLSGLGVQLVAFQLSGGIILFLFGIQMIFGSGVADTSAAADPDHDLAVFPLAIPSIASPGSIMAVVLLTDNHRQSVSEQALTAVVLVAVLAITFCALRLSAPIHKRLGTTGANVLVRVMGILLAALATEEVVEGLEEVLRATAGA